MTERSEVAAGLAPDVFTNAWGEPVEPHESDDCPTCGGSGFYKLPYGAPDDGREVEDEDNCYCDCHGG